MTKVTEIWKSIDGFPGYEVSNLGRIKSYKRKESKIIKPHLNSCGYFTIRLWNKHRIGKQLHVLVARAFLGLSKLTVNHKDGDKINNSIKNLEYLSTRENTIHWHESRKRKLPVGIWRVGNRFRSKICENGKRIHLGYFATKEEAGEAWRKRHNKICEEYAKR